MSQIIRDYLQRNRVTDTSADQILSIDGQPVEVWRQTQMLGAGFTSEVGDFSRLLTITMSIKVAKWEARTVNDVGYPSIGTHVGFAKAGIILVGDQIRTKIDPTIPGGSQIFIVTQVQNMSENVQEILLEVENGR